MLSCKETSRLLSESHDHGISLTKRVMLKLHLIMCKVCRRFAAQIDLIRRLARVAGDAGTDPLFSDEGVIHEQLSPQMKSRLKERLSRG